MGGPFLIFFNLPTSSQATPGVGLVDMQTVGSLTN